MIPLLDKVGKWFLAFLKLDQLPVQNIASIYHSFPNSSLRRHFAQNNCVEASDIAAGPASRAGSMCRTCLLKEESWHCVCLH